MSGRNRRILIIAAPFGSGHIQAALNLREAILEKSPEAKVRVLDSFMPDPYYPIHFFGSSYLHCIRRTPRLYNFLYHYFDHPKRGHYLPQFLFPAGQSRLYEEIKKFNPDLVLVTHPFPIRMLANIREQYGLTFLLGAIVTDFTVHAAWIHPNLDMYFVATEHTRQSLMKNGIANNKIKITGIPIAAQFAETMGKERARRNLGLSLTQPMVLVMGGGLGIGPMAKIIKKLNMIDTPLQMIFITGKNLRLKEELTGLAGESHHEIKVLGYTNGIHTLMAAADLLITKPGGLTCSEALAMELPMLIVEPIPGHEEENAAYLEETGAACWARDFKQVFIILSEIASLKQQPLTNQEAIKQLRRPQAAQAIAEIVFNDLFTPKAS